MSRQDFLNKTMDDEGSFSTSLACAKSCRKQLKKLSKYSSDDIGIGETVDLTTNRDTIGDRPTSLSGALETIVIPVGVFLIEKFTGLWDFVILVISENCGIFQIIGLPRVFYKKLIYKSVYIL